MSWKVFDLKRSIEGAFVIPLKVLSQKNKQERRCCFRRILVPLRDEKILSYTHKTGSWYILGVLCKISSKPSHPLGGDALLATMSRDSKHA